MQPLVVFDLFGTLLDIASLRTEAAAVTTEPDAFVASWREKQLAYAFASAIMDRHEDFDRITDRALRYAAAKHGVDLDARRYEHLRTAWERVGAYDDAVGVLERLQAQGATCAILTNGTPATAAAAMQRAGIAALIDATLSVESAGVFKPDPRVYALVTGQYRCRPDQVVFVSANGWDATGAAAFGMQVAWCNRAGAPAETFGPPPAWTLRGLAELEPIVAALPAGEPA